MNKTKLLPGILLVIIGALIITYQFINNKILLYCICASIILCGVSLVIGNIKKK